VTEEEYKKSQWIKYVYCVNKNINGNTGNLIKCRKKSKAEEAAGKINALYPAIGFYARHQLTTKKPAEIKVENSASAQFIV